MRRNKKKQINISMISPNSTTPWPNSSLRLKYVIDGHGTVCKFDKHTSQIQTHKTGVHIEIGYHTSQA